MGSKHLSFAAELFSSRPAFEEIVAFQDGGHKLRADSHLDGHADSQLKWSWSGNPGSGGPRADLERDSVDDDALM